MITHLTFIYFLLTFLIGIISATVLILIALKTRKDVLKYFLFFYIAFTVNIIIYTVIIYIRTNIPDINFSFYVILTFLYISVSYFLVFSVLFFVHFLINLHKRNIFNLIFGLLLLIIAIIDILTFNVDFENKSISSKLYLENVNTDIPNIIIVVVIAYTFIISMIFYKKITDSQYKTIIKISLIFICFSIPSTIIDTLSPKPFNIPIYFFPIIYFLFGIIFTVYFSRYYLSKMTYSFDKDDIEHFLEKYDISEREKDVLLLIIKGLSNKVISDKLFISLNTVKAHNKSLFKKLNIKSRFELVSLMKLDF